LALEPQISMPLPPPAFATHPSGIVLPTPSRICSWDVHAALRTTRAVPRSRRSFRLLFPSLSWLLQLPTTLASYGLNKLVRRPLLERQIILIVAVLLRPVILQQVPWLTREYVRLSTLISVNQLMSKLLHVLVSINH